MIVTVELTRDAKKTVCGAERFGAITSRNDAKKMFCVDRQCIHNQLIVCIGAWRWCGGADRVI